MRVSVSNWQTSPEDVKRTLDGVRRAVQQMRAASMSSSAK
jgi:hypothetical protein